MRRTTIVNLNRSKFLSSIQQNKLIIIMTLFYIIGIVAGVLWVGRSNEIATLANVNFQNYLKVRSDSSIFKVFISSLMSYLPFGLISFLCGTSLVGIVLAPLAICYSGFQYGIMAGLLYTNYQLKGIAFNSLMLIPCTLIFVFGLLYAGKSAFTFSLKLAKITMPKGQAANIYNDLQIYCRQFLIIVLVFATASLIDSLMSVSFIEYFNF